MGKKKISAKVQYSDFNKYITFTVVEVPSHHCNIWKKRRSKVPSPMSAKKNSHLCKISACILPR